MTASVRIRTALASDFGRWAAMRLALWPEEPDVGRPADMHAWLDDVRKTALLAIDDEGDAIGFAELALRGDYVNGTHGLPVGFLEAWYVVPEWRGHGVGRALITAAEGWARSRGCAELASDALLDNTASHTAHAGCGFEETERVVYFRKVLA